MNEPRQPGPPHPPPQQHPQPHHPAAHPQAPQIHPAPGRPASIPTPVAPSTRPGIAPMPTMHPSLEDDLEPIELVDEEPMPVGAPVAPGGPTQLRTAAHQHQQQPAPAPKKIIAFGADGHKAHHDWKRQPVRTGNGACRVRSFHGKYSEQGLDYLDNAINEWLDSHPEVEVKFVTSTVMTFEGKIREPALVLNVWY